MAPHTNFLIAIIVVVTIGMFLVGIVWRLYHGGGEDRGYDGDRD